MTRHIISALLVAATLSTAGTAIAGITPDGKTCNTAGAPLHREQIDYNRPSGSAAAAKAKTRQILWSIAEQRCHAADGGAPVVVHEMSYGNFRGGAARSYTGAGEIAWYCSTQCR